jgi:hypothetical protein
MKPLGYSYERGSNFGFVLNIPKNVFALFGGMCSPTSMLWEKKDMSY